MNQSQVIWIPGGNSNGEQKKKSTNELRGSFKGNLGSLLRAFNMYNKLTFLKGSESEVWKVASQFGVAGRLLQLAVRHGGVKLKVWSRGKTDFLCVLLNLPGHVNKIELKKKKRSYLEYNVSSLIYIATHTHTHI